MVEIIKWQVKSNGLNFIIFDPGDEFRTVAECSRKEDAHLICDMRNGCLADARIEAYSDTKLAEVASKITAEVIDTEEAIISTKETKQWTRHYILQGHKAGLLWSNNRIQEILSKEIL